MVELYKTRTGEGYGTTVSCMRCRCVRQTCRNLGEVEDRQQSGEALQPLCHCGDVSVPGTIDKTQLARPLTGKLCHFRALAIRSALL